MMVMIGAAAVAVVVIVFFMVSGSGGDERGAPAEPATATAQPASQPVKPAPVRLGAGTAGKTPKRPAPPLTAATLAQLDELYREASQLFNEGLQKREAGEHMAARDCQAKANKLLNDWTALVDDPLLWQEEAQLEGWAQPAEYVSLMNRWPKFSALQKKVRMQGGQ